MSSPAPRALFRTLSLSAVAFVAFALWAGRGHAAAASAVNSAPVANADTATAVEAGGTNNGTPGTDISGYNVITGVGTGSVADTDPDGDTLTVQGILDGNQGSTPITGNVSGPGLSANSPKDYGAIYMHTDGSYDYVVNQSNATVQALRTSSQSVDDVFTYTVRDPSGATSNATITIHIQGANDNPVAVNDSANATEAGGTSNGTAGSDPSGNLLTNDTDVDSSANGETKTVQGVLDGDQGSTPINGNVGAGISANSPKDYGVLTVAANGNYSYVVNQNNATVQALNTSSTPLDDVFTYTMRDAAGATSNATLTIHIQGANDAPVASADSYSTSDGTVLSVTAANGVLANDSDVDTANSSLTAVLVSGPSHASSFALNSDGSFSYMPSQGYNGSDSFQYKANDGSLDSNTVTVSITVTPFVPSPGQVVISEFRFRGPNGSQDEFIELSNQTNADMTVATADSSAGWAVVAYNPSTQLSTTIYTVPVGTVIPARGHFLVTNAGTNGGGGYSLGLYASPDTDANNALATYTGDIPDNGGIALFNSSSNLTDTTRLDAVGCSAATGFYETAPLAPVTDGSPLNVPPPPQFSYARKLTTGKPLDTNNNSNDFILVSVRPDLITSATAQQGAPGPENTASPVNRGDLIKARLIDATQTVNDPPNRQRNASPYTDSQTPSDPAGNTPGAAPYANGWLAIRRRFVNNTGAQVTGLRFRIVDITANGTNVANTNGTADLRALSSADVIVTSHDPTVCNAQPSCSVTVRGLKVDQQGPMPQTRGGGFNTSLSIDLSGNPVPVGGGTVDVQFLLGVQQAGTFHFFVIVEALPGVNNTAADLGGPPAPAGFNSTKRAGAATPKAGPGKGTSVKGKQ